LPPVAAPHVINVVFRRVTVAVLQRVILLTALVPLAQQGGVKMDGTACRARCMCARLPVRPHNTAPAIRPVIPWMVHAMVSLLAGLCANLDGTVNQWMVHPIPATNNALQRIIVQVLQCVSMRTGLASRHILVCHGVKTDGGVWMLPRAPCCAIRSAIQPTIAQRVLESATVPPDTVTIPARGDGAPLDSGEQLQVATTLATMRVGAPWNARAVIRRPELVRVRPPLPILNQIACN